MAQLKDDCFAFDGGLMPVDDALSALAERVTCVAGTETVSLRNALGRVLAEDVASPRNVPPRSCAAHLRPRRAVKCSCAHGVTSI